MAFVTPTDLRTALSLKTYIAIFDDALTGAVSEAISPAPGFDPGVAQVLRRAHAEVVSWIFQITDSDPNSATQSDLLFSAELDFAVAFAFERHPAYVRAFGEVERASRMKRASDKMQRIQEGLQRYSAVGTTAATVVVPKQAGGIVLADAVHVFDE